MTTETDAKYANAMVKYYKLERNYEMKNDEYLKCKKLMKKTKSKRNKAFKTLDDYVGNELVKAQCAKRDQDCEVE